MTARSPYSRNHMTVDVAGQEVSIPYAPAAVWVEALLSEAGTLGLLATLTDDTTGYSLISCVLTGDLDPRAVQDASYALLGAATPYKWWKSARLLGLAARDDIAGHLTLSGVDPWKVSVSQLVCAVYCLVTKGTDAKAKFKIDAVIDDPPEGVSDDEWMNEDEFAALVAAARATPGQT